MKRLLSIALAAALAVTLAGGQPAAPETDFHAVTHATATSLYTVVVSTIVPSPNGNWLIMPLGDSFAQGLSSDSTNGNNGYRADLNTNIYGPNETHNIQWVGSQVSGTAGLHHEGHGGYTIADISSLVASGALANPAPANVGPPQIVILTIGSNDFGLNHTWSQVLNDMSALIDQILAVSPNLAILVTEQIQQSGSISHQLTDNSRRQQAYNEHLVAMITTKPAGRVYVVTTSGILQRDLDSGGVHLTNLGYQKMSWFIYYALAPILGWDDGDGHQYMANRPTPFVDVRPS